jgi:hypothetical protein
VTARRRSGLLVLLLPGLAGGTIYIYWGKPRIERAAREMAEAAERARAGRPHASQEAELAVRERTLQEEADRLERLRAAGNPAVEPDGDERLAMLLARHNVLLLEETLDPAAPGTLPESVQKAGPGRLRRLTFSGRYLDVLSALRGLLDLRIGAVPLRLVMSREDGDVRWTLLLWM